MFLNFGLVINAVLMVLGILWCHEMFKRWRKDLAEFKGAKDAGTRRALVLIWGVTAVIVVLLFNFFAGILDNLGIL